MSARPYIKTLKEARQRLATVEAMNLVNDPAARARAAAAKVGPCSLTPA